MPHCLCWSRLFAGFWRGTVIFFLLLVNFLRERRVVGNLRLSSDGLKGEVVNLGLLQFWSFGLVLFAASSAVLKILVASALVRCLLLWGGRRNNLPRCNRLAKWNSGKQWRWQVLKTSAINIFNMMRVGSDECSLAPLSTAWTRLAIIIESWIYFFNLFKGADFFELWINFLTLLRRSVVNKLLVRFFIIFKTLSFAQHCCMTVLLLQFWS